MFRLRAGLDVLHVPYRSNPQAVNDVIGGQISYMFADTMFCLSQAQNGKCLAVTSKERSRLAPHLPSMHEAGVTDFDLTAWFAVFAPAKTPKPIVEKLHGAFAQALADEALVERMLTTGFEPSLSSPAELKRFVQSETVKWAQIIKEAGIEPQ
jgi:tripartite-type tricarboxylate transporter receptor subunit TctC